MMDGNFISRKRIGGIVALSFLQFGNLSGQERPNIVMILADDVRDLACLFVRVWWNRWVELSVWSQKKEKALAFGLLILIRKWLVVFWYRRGV